MLCEIWGVEGTILGKFRQEPRAEDAKSFKHLESVGIKLWVTSSASVHDLEQLSLNSG